MAALHGRDCAGIRVVSITGRIAVRCRLQCLRLPVARVRTHARGRARSWCVRLTYVEVRLRWLLHVAVLIGRGW